MNTLTRFNPFADVQMFRNSIDRLLEETFGEPFVRMGRQQQWTPTWSLPLDVLEQEDGFVVTVSIPGIDPDQLDITLNNNVLTIQGELQAPELGQNEAYHLRERSYGRFHRTIQFPVPVESDAVEATYKYGILTLNIPKVESAKPKHIPVKVEGNGQRVLEGQHS